MVRYCDWPLNAMQFWGVGEFGKWCCFTVQNLGQVRKTMSLDYGRQYLNFSVFLWGVCPCWNTTALRNKMYLDVSKKVLQGTYITDGEVRIQESFVSSLGSLSSVAYFFFWRNKYWTIFLERNLGVSVGTPRKKIGIGDNNALQFWIFTLF